MASYSIGGHARARSWTSALSAMATASYDNWVEPDLFPEVAPLPLTGSTWILGRHYILPQDKAAVNKDARNRLWFTYRKNFREIGGTQYTTDAGWGCTIRCGQMALGQALLCLHLGRDWVWEPTCTPAYQRYMKVLRMFLDSRDSIYSIQHITLQGADFGRSVGQWFGPNNVAQAIKRLSVHEGWSKLVVYVAMDMLVVTDDIKEMCRTPYTNITVPVSVTNQSGELITSSQDQLHFPSYNPHLFESSPIPRRSTSANSATSSQPSFGPSSVPVTRAMSLEPLENSLLQLSMDDIDKLNPTAQNDNCEPCPPFRPLLMFIPLRLGQEKFNMEYAAALKACFSLPQSVGIIGGKPRHALWLIGYNGNSVFYLDPHTTQQTVQVPDGWFIPDNSYHTDQAEIMSINDLDPSLALGFFCKDEDDFNDLCERLKKEVLCKMTCMFELTDKRPSYWGSKELSQPTKGEPFVLLESEMDSDEGFELVDWPIGPVAVPHEDTHT